MNKSHYGSRLGNLYFELSSTGVSSENKRYLVIEQMLLMAWTWSVDVCSCLIFTNQCTVVHHLRIFETALIFIEETQIVDGVERRSVLRSSRFLFTTQRTVVHHLRIFETTLVGIDDTQIVDGVQRGHVLRSPCLLITCQRTVEHHLRTF